MVFHYLQRLGAYTGYRGARFLRKNHLPLRSFSCETIIHAPEERGYCPPPVTLDGQLERATGNFWSPLSGVIKNAVETENTHTATILYKIDNVTVDNGFLYKGGNADYLSSLGPPKFEKPRHKTEGVLCSSPTGSLYFGCWMYGDNLLDGIAKERDQYAIKVMPHKNYFHLPEANQILNLSDHYLTQPTTFDHLYIVDDGGYNKNKVERIKNLRKLYEKSASSIKEKNRYVYLERGKSANPRILSNEKEITDYLASCGFKIINPEHMTFSEIADEIVGCEIVMGVEGSQFTHGLLGVKEGGYVIQLEPPYHFQPTDRPRCESVGVRWGFLVGFENNKGFEIPLDDVKKLLGKIL